MQTAALALGLRHADPDLVPERKDAPAAPMPIERLAVPLPAPTAVAALLRLSGQSAAQQQKGHDLS